MRKITPLIALADSQIREKAMGHLQEISNIITIKEKEKEKDYWKKYNDCVEELRQRTIDRKDYGLI
mgnify:CR=1 FL=1